MTTTLTHPAAEDLGRFIEGTLEEPERAAIVAHVADCDECRIVMVDAAEFAEEPAVKRRSIGGRWWMSAAAAIVIVVGGVWLVDARRDPLAPVMEATARLSSRPVEARLSSFQYVGWHAMRGEEQETDPVRLQLEVEVGKVLERQGSSAKTLHALGIAHLLNAALKKVDPQSSDVDRRNDAEAIRSERAKAVEALHAAVAAAPNNVQYRSDLAAALIATGDSESLRLAVDACDQAIKMDARAREALFNRAVALRDLRDKRATEAFRRYLEVDPSSPWAEEAKQQIDTLT